MSNNMTEKILIIDDHPVVLDGIQLLLSSLRPDAEILTAKNAADAIAIITSNNPIEWLFVDINLPDMSGLELITIIKEKRESSRIVVLSSELEIQTIDHALTLKANGVLSKSFDKDIFELCLMTIELGNVFLTSEHATELQYYRDSLLLELQHIEKNVTQRQLQVLTLLDKGHTNKVISEYMNISESTVKVHVSALMGLLNANNRTHCVAIARRLKLI